MGGRAHPGIFVKSKSMRLAAVLLAALVLAAAAGAAGRPTVTISATAKVSGGDQIVLLSGAVSNHKPGEPVTIEADDCGPLSRRPAYRVRTATQGGWASNGDTEINTRYRARWKKAVSRIIRVDARPQVTLRTNGVGFHVEVRALDFFNGRTAVLQRYDVEARKWRDVARTTLHRAGSAAELGVSAGTFRGGAHGKLRAILPAKQVAPCYTTGISASLNF
jgi:hypothetical protein